MAWCYRANWKAFWLSNEIVAKWYLHGRLKVECFFPRPSIVCSSYQFNGLLKFFGLQLVMKFFLDSRIWWMREINFDFTANLPGSRQIKQYIVYETDDRVTNILTLMHAIHWFYRTQCTQIFPTAQKWTFDFWKNMCRVPEMHRCIYFHHQSSIFTIELAWRTLTTSSYIQGSAWPRTKKPESA